MYSCDTSNRPCLLVRVFPSMVQKLMWDFPQVTIRLVSMGWNTAASTESLEHCRDRSQEAIVSFYLLRSWKHTIKILHPCMLSKKFKTRRSIMIQLYEWDQTQVAIPWLQPAASPSASSRLTRCDHWHHPQRKGRCRHSGEWMNK